MSEVDSTQILTQIRDYMATLATDASADLTMEARHVDHPMLPLNTLGSACLWIGCICMAASSVYFLSHASKSENNSIEMLTFFITAIATVAYLTMASGYGVMDTHTRQPFYYARYIDWLFTTPLMVWDLMELTGADAMHIFTVVGLDALMIVCGIVGSLLVEASVKWVFFILGCVFFALVVKELQAGMGKGAAGAQGVYAAAAKLTIISWTCYPIVWALCEGGDLVGVNVSCLLYTIMDVTAKCVFGILIVSNRDALEAVNRAKRNQGVEAVPFLKTEEN